MDIIKTPEIKINNPVPVGPKPGSVALNIICGAGCGSKNPGTLISNPVMR